MRLAALTGGALARLKAKRALRDSQERLQLALAAGVTVFDSDVRTGKVVWRPAPDGQSMPLERGSEHTCEALERRTHPEDATRLKAFFADWFASGHDKEKLEYRLLHRNGEMRWKLSSARLIRSPEGEARRVIGTTVDITGRKRTENLLSAERNLTVVSAGPTPSRGLCGSAPKLPSKHRKCSRMGLSGRLGGRRVESRVSQGAAPGLAEKLAHPGHPFESSTRWGWAALPPPRRV